jgi:phosphatidylserine/phosphatidylglycerophosphate/cardiolipin synthase-like enzyme
MSTRWLWCAVLCAASLAEQMSARGTPADGVVPGAVSPEEWARMRLDGCSAEQRRREEDLVSLADTLTREAQSKEEQSFADQEARVYSKLLEKERHVQLNQLNYLLFRSREKVFEEVFRHRLQVGHRLPWVTNFFLLDSQTFGRAMEALTEGSTPCALDVLESTLLVAAFGLPLKKQWVEERITPEQVLGEVENEYARQAKLGRTLEDTYVELRPKNERQSNREIEAVLEGMTTGSPSQTGVNPELRRPLIQQIGHFFQLAAAPLRLKQYLTMVVATLDTSVGVRISQTSVDRLQENVEKKLYKDLEMMRKFAASSPRENVNQTYPIIDDWFQNDALPELQKRLFHDPFSAYWFYVQTGMIAQKTIAFRGAKVQVDPTTPDLKTLKRHSMEGSHQLLFRSKIPRSYVERFRELERSMTETVVPSDEFRRRLIENGEKADVRARLVRLLPPEGKVSSLDLLSATIRDASRFQGALDTDALKAGFRVFHQAKRDTLDREINTLPQAPDRSRLAIYLRTAGEWMLELEEREASEHSFQEALGGGPIGWLLRHTVIGNGVPVELWAPGGVTGEAFTRLVDGVVAENPKSGWSYRGKDGSDVRFVDSGEAYHRVLFDLINNAKDFLNIQQFDWQLDRGGKEVTYRLMAKKLGLTAHEYEALVEEFQSGVRLDSAAKTKTLFFDIPPSKMKNLLVYELISHTEREPLKALRQKLASALEGKLDCPSVEACGDLSKLYSTAGTGYDQHRKSEARYQQAWEVYRELQALFDERVPELKDIRPQPSLADYLRDRSRVQRFIRRFGLKRTDAPERPFDLNILVDGKQDLGKVRWLRPSTELPYVYSYPVRDLHNQLFEFDVKLVLWKGIIEFPWHIGPLPIGGRWIGGVFPFPYIPWPWLQYVPGFGPEHAWGGIGWSMIFQHLMATDIRTWWAMASHTKSVASESTSLESGMGFATRYFNLYPGFRTWHDAGIVARGPVVGDVNDRFVRQYNRARVNNRGIPESHGVKMPPLRYEDYAYGGQESPGYRSWVLTTNTDGKDYDYRGVFLAALAAARESIYIENVFFSAPLISRMLVRKAREFRGRVNCNGLTDLECGIKKRDAVKIYLILPEATDKASIDLVGRSDFYRMINEGVKVYRWNPRSGYSARKMLHTKAWLIDYQEARPALAYVGSHNADQRSLWADNEMGILTTSPTFAKALHDGLFVGDLKNDSIQASRSSFEVERLMNPEQALARFVRLVMMDLSWFF